MKAERGVGKAKLQLAIPVRGGGMAENMRRIVCWNCKQTFRVDIGEIGSAKVIVYRGRKQEEQTPKKLVVECPHCGKENEIMV